MVRLCSLTLMTLVLLVGAHSSGAIPVRQAANEKQERYVPLGVFVGGQDHGPLVLFNVRHSLTSKFERLVFDVGQKKSSGIERPGFFHISIQESPKRVVVDLENVTQTNVDARQIAKLFSKSPFFSKVSIYEDGTHKNLTLELPLKVKAQMEVFELVTPGKPGRIVMDVRNL
jgi:hypothetical protein